MALTAEGFDFKNSTLQINKLYQQLKGIDVITDPKTEKSNRVIEMGFSALAIADRVGHKSIDIIYRYSHLFPNKQTEVANKLESKICSSEVEQEVLQTETMEEL